MTTLKEISERIFKNICIDETVKEAITLQLFGNLKILFVSDPIKVDLDVIQIIQDNFNFIKCIPYFNDFTKLGDIILDGSVLARASPKFGYFDTNQEILDQLELPLSSTSQFDIIFTLRDIPNEETDKKNVENLFLKKSDKEEINCFLEEIKSKRDLKVIWLEEAKNNLIELYLKNRKQKHSQMNFICLSQIEKIKKISECYAKANGRVDVEVEDVKNSIKLVGKYILPILDDKIN